MPVPETPMYKDYGPKLRKDQVRMPWQFTGIEPIAIAKLVEGLA
jgi:hypothetical protein